jgi:lipopolysaccharide export system protein LptC
MKRFAFKKLRVLVILLLMTITGSAVVGYVIHQMMTGPHQVIDLHVDSDAALKLGGMKQISKNNGITEWELEAATATLTKERNQALLTQVQVVFHTQSNDQVFLTADQGILDTRTHDMDFTGNVVVRHRTYTLKTDKLHYKKKAHIIHSDTKVWLESTQAAMEADTMKIHINEKALELQGHVKGRFSENFYLP